MYVCTYSVCSFLIIFDFIFNYFTEVIGGMLDLEPRVWRNPKREPFDLQKKKVLSFGGKWKRYDITKPKNDSSSSSEDD